MRASDARARDGRVHERDPRRVLLARDGGRLGDAVREGAEPLRRGPADGLCERGHAEAAELHGDDARAVPVRGQRAHRDPVRDDEPGAAARGSAADGRGQRAVRVHELQPPERRLQRDDGEAPARDFRGPVSGAVCDLQHDSQRGEAARARREDDPERDAAAHHFDGVPAPAAAAGGVGAAAGDGGASDRKVERCDDARVMHGVGVARLREQGMQAAGRDAPGVDVCAEHGGLLQGLCAELGAEGAGGRVAEKGDLGREAHAEAEVLLLAAAEHAVLEGLVICCGRARNGDAVVEARVEIPRLHVDCAVDVHGAREALQELYLAVAVGGVEVRDDFVPDPLRVLFRVVEMDFNARHKKRGSSYYMFAG